MKPLPIDYSEVINVSVISDNGEEESVDMVKSDILNIIYPVVKMSFSVIKKYIEDKNFTPFVNRIIITGGGALIENVKGVAEEVFELPVRVAKPTKLDGLNEEYVNVSNATLIGLFLFNFYKSSSALKLNSEIEFERDNSFFGKIRKFINDNF